MSLYRGYFVPNRVDPLGLTEFLPAAKCKKAMNRRKEKIDKLIGLRGRAARFDVGDCRANADCEVVTIIINLGHSCLKDTVFRFIGHTGIAIGEDYYDYGPDGDVDPYVAVPGIPWWDDPVTTILTDILDDMDTLATDDGVALDVLKIEICAKVPHCGKLREWWEDKYSNLGNFCIPGTHCTSAVIWSIEDSTGHAKQEKWGGMAPEFYLQHISEHYTHGCGSNAGKPVKIEHIQKEEAP
jgi:hypothetical protein